jgi:acetyl-CoA carboxylase carboxyl transferase subunit beta
VKEAIDIGPRHLNGRPIAYGAFVFAFMGGSMGSVVGEKVTRLFERAADEACPSCSSSLRRRAHAGGHLSLMQMAKSVSALERFRQRQAPLPQCSYTRRRAASLRASLSSAT